MKQRDQVAMTSDEAAGLLAAGRKVQLATNGADGFPHLVTMYYVMIDGLHHVLDLPQVAEGAQPGRAIRGSPAWSRTARSTSTCAAS